MAHRFSFNYVATKNDEFNLAIGVASGRWSHIEAGLCLWFKKVTKMPHTMARSVFYSVSGFDGRRRMFQGAIGNAKIPNELRDYLNLLTSKAGNYSGSRNRMAHVTLFSLTARSRNITARSLFWRGKNSGK